MKYQSIVGDLPLDLDVTVYTSSGAAFMGRIEETVEQSELLVLLTKRGYWCYINLEHVVAVQWASGEPRG